MFVQIHWLVVVTVKIQYCLLKRSKLFELDTDRYRSRSLLKLPEWVFQRQYSIN